LEKRLRSVDLASVVRRDGGRGDSPRRGEQGEEE
jgi:hypothetical protein